MTIVAVDVAYEDDEARAAGVSFAAFTDAEPAETHVIEVGSVAPYVPGSLYLRELPPLRVVLDLFTDIEVVIVDGHVELGNGPGLGAHLQASLHEAGLDVAVIGVAKNPYRGAPAVEVLRGASERPLYVTAAGMSVDEAAAHVRSMHGPHRLPTLLKLADTLTRQPSISP